MKFAGSLVLGVMLTAASSVFGKIEKVLNYKKAASNPFRYARADCDSALMSLAAEHGFSVKTSEDAADLLNLKAYDLVVFNNNVGTGVPTEEARQALIKYLEEGGSWFGIFATADHKNTWKWYNDVLFSGKRYNGLTTGAITLQTDRDLAEDAALSRMWKDAGFKDTITFTATYIRFNEDVDIRADPDVKVVQKIVKASGPISADDVITWTKRIGKGRMLFTGSGHGIPAKTSLPSDWVQNDAWLKKALWHYMKYLNGQYDNPVSAVTEGERWKNPPEPMAETGQVELYDLGGRRIAARTVGLPGGFDFSRMAPRGLYFARIESRSAVTTRKIVIP